MLVIHYGMGYDKEDLSAESSLMVAKVSTTFGGLELEQRIIHEGSSCSTSLRSFTWSTSLPSSFQS